MITHIALYRFPDGTPDAHVDGFKDALATATQDTGLAREFDVGSHIRLPADDRRPDATFAVGATWDFDDIDRLEDFSNHEAMGVWVRKWVRGHDVDLAIVNFERDDG
jgi:hypothetical protein